VVVYFVTEKGAFPSRERADIPGSMAAFPAKL